MHNGQTLLPVMTNCWTVILSKGGRRCWEFHRAFNVAFSVTDLYLLAALAAPCGSGTKVILSAAIVTSTELLEARLIESSTTRS